MPKIQPARISLEKWKPTKTLETPIKKATKSKIIPKMWLTEYATTPKDAKIAECSEGKENTESTSKSARTLIPKGRGLWKIIFRMKAKSHAVTMAPVTKYIDWIWKKIKYKKDKKIARKGKVLALKV